MSETRLTSSSLNNLPFICQSLRIVSDEEAAPHLIGMPSSFHHIRFHCTYHIPVSDKGLLNTVLSGGNLPGVDDSNGGQVSSLVAILGKLYQHLIQWVPTSATTPLVHSGVEAEVPLSNDCPSNHFQWTLDLNEFCIRCRSVQFKVLKKRQNNSASNNNSINNNEFGFTYEAVVEANWSYQVRSSQ